MYQFCSNETVKYKMNNKLTEYRQSFTILLHALIRAIILLKAQHTMASI